APARPPALKRGSPSPSTHHPAGQDSRPIANRLGSDAPVRACGLGRPWPSTSLDLAARLRIVVMGREFESLGDFEIVVRAPRDMEALARAVLGPFLGVGELHATAPRGHFHPLRHPGAEAIAARRQSADVL